MDLLGTALIGTVETVVRDHANGRRIAVGHVLKPLGHKTNSVVQDEDPGRVRRAAGHVDQHGVPIQQRRRHAVAFDVHDAQLRRAGLEAALYPGPAEVVCAAGRVMILCHHRTTAHRGAWAGMGDRHKCLVGVLDEGWLALDFADAVDQPFPLDLQHARDLRQLVDAGPR